jgi:site-specific DNA-methyltransferase (adenine-specific)
MIYLTRGARATWSWLGESEMRNVFTGPAASDSERFGHPTTKPAWLLDKLIRVSGLPGGRLLDPFAGSGTSGVAALSAGMSATLIEPAPEFIQMIRARLADAEL